MLGWILRLGLAMLVLFAFLPPSPGSAQSSNAALTEVSTIYLGPQAGNGRAIKAIAFNSSRPLAYTANADSSNVSVIDLTTNQITAVIPTGFGARQLAYNPKDGRLYLITSSTDSNDLFVIDTNTNKVVSRIKRPGFYWDMALDTDAGKIYTASGYDLNVFDIASGQWDSIPVGTFQPHAFAFDMPHKRLYLLAGFSSTRVMTIDLVDMELINSDFLPLPNAAAALHGLAVDPAHNELYVAQDSPPLLYIIDADSYEIKDAYKLPQPPIPDRAVTYDAASRTVYVAMVSEPRLAAIDLNAESKKYAQSLPPLQSLTLDPGKHQIWVAGDTEISVLKSDLQPDKTLVTGFAEPQAVVPSPDGNLLYVQSSNGIETIDTATKQVTRKIFTAQSNLLDIAPVGGQLFASQLTADGKSLTIVSLDPNTGTTQPLGTVNWTQVGKPALNTRTNTLYLPHAPIMQPDGETRTDAAITAIDLNTHTSTRITLSAPSGTSVTLDASRNKIYTALRDGHIARIDGDTKRFIGLVAPDKPEPPDQAQAADLVYITGPSDNMTAIDAATDRIALTLAGQTGSVYNPANGHLYRMDSSGSLLVSNGRTGQVLGEFASPYALVPLSVQPNGGLLYTIERMGDRPTGAIKILRDTATENDTVSQWYFAEGATVAPYSTELAILNPGFDPAWVTVQFEDEYGGVAAGSYRINPQSRRTLVLNDLLPGYARAFSMHIFSDKKVYVERTMSSGSDATTDAPAQAPATTWYFAEGSSAGGFETWLLLQNPNSQSADVTLTIYTAGGASKVEKVSLLPDSRRSIRINGLAPASDLSMKVEATQPVIAERTMYFGKNKAGSHVSAGSPTLSSAWYFAEGFTGAPYTTWFLLFNPNDQPALATVIYFIENGKPVLRRYIIAPHSRISLLANQDLPANSAFATQISSDQPLVAERSIYFADDQGGHNVMGVSTPAHTWYLPEGNTLNGSTEYILVANPNYRPVNLSVTLMDDTGGVTIRNYTLAPVSRFTINANYLVAGRSLSAIVSADQPIVAERVEYSNNGLSGTASTGIAER